MIRRTALALAASVVSLVLGAAAPAVAESEDNAAIAVNTQDGASLFRLAFSVQTVANGTVDETNTAAALARCEDCQTVALAFQVVLVYGDADVVVPENRAIAFNDECSACLTYASATQIVLGVPHGTHFTQAGRERLLALQERLAALEGTVGELSVVELDAEVQAAKQELVAIIQEELVAPPRADGDDGTTTTTGATSTSTSTTTSDTQAPTTTSDVTTTTVAVAASTSTSLAAG